jgi:hypothetical protein
MFSPTVTGRALKVTVVLDSAEIVALRVPDGQPRTTLRIEVGGRDVCAVIATKSLRKAIATIRQTGVDGCVALIQGKLGPGDVVLECGLVAQVKTPKVDAALQAIGS